MTTLHTSGKTNGWLQALPEASRSKLLEHARHVELAARQCVQELRSEAGHVYFPLTAIFSVVVPMSGGKTVESIMVGREGYSPPFAGVSISNTARTVVDVPGDALCVPSAVFAHLTATDPAIGAAQRLSISATFDALMQGAACNAVHSVRERCARWLLSLADRTGSNEIAIIHQALAEVLGASRPRVTEILASLQNDGLIGIQRASLRITDCAGLRAAACECYHVLRREYSAKLDLAS